MATATPEHEILPVVEAVPAVPAATGLRALIKLARPRQWTKNVLVFAAPAAAGTLTDLGMFRDTLLAFVAFCLASSATYMVNDARDVEADRRHPVKRMRPVASGAISVTAAYSFAVLAALASLAFAAAADPWLVTVVVGYLALTTAYSTRLKHEPVLDICAVALGFFLRAVAGGVATSTPLSRWFVIVTAFGSLYLVTGKRYAEVLKFSDRRGDIRRSLDGYTAGYLTHVLAVAAGVAIVGYCAWSLVGYRSLAAQLSIIPFVVGILRFGLIIDRGEAAEPEEIFLRDRQLQVIGLAWAVLMAIDVYVS
jgi:decaprenyl-phosphate phosphoribosyltransferase